MPPGRALDPQPRGSSRRSPAARARAIPAALRSRHRRGRSERRGRRDGGLAQLVQRSAGLWRRARPEDRAGRSYACGRRRRASSERLQRALSRGAILQRGLRLAAAAGPAGEPGEENARCDRGSRRPSRQALRKGRVGERCAKQGCSVGGSGISSPPASRGGGAPPTPPPRLGNQLWSSHSGPLPRHLRPYARRKEPPHGARPLPRGARRGRRAGDAGRPEAVRGRLAPGGVRALHAPRARRSCRRCPRGSTSSSASSTAARTTPSSTRLGGSWFPSFLGEHAQARQGGRGRRCRATAWSCGTGPLGTNIDRRC